FQGNNKSKNGLNLSKREQGRYIENYIGDLRREMNGVLYHESTHVWQWDGNDKAPGGLIEGIADYVRLKSGYAPSDWVKPWEGNHWD
ncbi:hypothetical protein HAX54_026437, partial [Datura stramonium]|nr:hypothetical protein [Datura stramonium]